MLAPSRTAARYGLASLLLCRCVHAQSAVIAYLTSAYNIAPSDATPLASKLSCKDPSRITTMTDAQGHISVACPSDDAQTAARILGELEPDNFVNFFQAALAPAPMPGGPAWQPLPSKTASDASSAPSSIPSSGSQPAVPSFDPDFSVEAFLTTSCASDKCAKNMCQAVVSTGYVSPLITAKSATCSTASYVSRTPDFLCQCPTPSSSGDPTSWWTWFMSPPYTVKELWAYSTMTSGLYVQNYTTQSKCDQKDCGIHACYPVAASNYQTDGFIFTPMYDATTATCTTDSTISLCQCPTALKSCPSGMGCDMYMAKTTSPGPVDPFDQTVTGDDWRTYVRSAPCSGGFDNCASVCATLPCAAITTSDTTYVSEAYCKGPTSYLTVITTPAVVTSVLGLAKQFPPTIDVTVSTLTQSTLATITTTGYMCACSAGNHFFPIPVSTMLGNDIDPQTFVTQVSYSLRTYVHSYPILLQSSQRCDDVCKEAYCVDVTKNSFNQSLASPTCLPSHTWTT